MTYFHHTEPRHAEQPKCGGCRKPLIKDAVFCPYCGYTEGAKPEVSQKQQERNQREWCRDAGIRSGWSRRARIQWKVYECAKRYATGRWTQAELAAKYRVTQGCVSKWVHGFFGGIFPNSPLISRDAESGPPRVQFAFPPKHGIPGQPLSGRNGQAPMVDPWCERPYWVAFPKLCKVTIEYAC